MSIKLFLDSSEINEIGKWKDKIGGVTTNPTLMRKAGIADYEKFCKEVLEVIPDKPVSFEVFADEFDGMERQAKIISSWGENVYVKIPVTNTKGAISYDVIFKLLNAGVKVNATAITAANQVGALPIPLIGQKMIVSYFAGRVADTGVNPMEVVKEIKEFLANAELLWASPREVLNIYQAEQAGADIITCTPDLLEKYFRLKGKDLNEFSLETVKMFYGDAQKAGYKL